MNEQVKLTIINLIKRLSLDSEYIERLKLDIDYIDWLELN